MRRQGSNGELVWAPNIDYWLSVNYSQGTLPEKYRNMSRNDIIRAVDGAIWNRVNALVLNCDPAVKHIYGRRNNGVRYHEINTPLGSIYEEYSVAESEYSAYACTKHFVTDVESLRVMTYIAEGTDYSANFGDTYKAVEETGEDGIILHQIFSVPFIQFAKNDAGYIDAFYMLEDYPNEVGRLISAYHKKYIEAIRLLSDTPADVIALGDNMDEVTVSPKLFERYAAGFYRECKDALKDSGKILETHWCGRTRNLLPLLPRTGIDVVEAVVTEPMANITLEEALDSLDGKVTLQGGIPAVMLCPNVVSKRDFEDYIENIVLKQKGRAGFILGMSDNVPPDADFSRVEIISEILR